MPLTPVERESILQRRDVALKRLDEGHEILLKSLEGLEAEEAFLGAPLVGARSSAPP